MMPFSDSGTSEPPPANKMSAKAEIEAPDSANRHGQEAKQSDSQPAGQGPRPDETTTMPPPQNVKDLLALNPGLAREALQSSGVSDPTPDQVASFLSKMNLQDVMAGLAASGKKAKDMDAYKFWQTQPVPRFGEDDKIAPEGPLKVQTVDQVPKLAQPLVAGFEWVTMDLKSDEEMKEVYELLNGHYVEDDEAMFRFNYSPSVLRWFVIRTPSPIP